jgi:hypothetical protein
MSNEAQRAKAPQESVFHLTVRVVTRAPFPEALRSRPLNRFPDQPLIETTLASGKDRDMKVVLFSDSCIYIRSDDGEQMTQSQG